MSAIIDAILGRLPDIEPVAFSSGVHEPNSDRTIQTTRHVLGVDGTLTGVEAVVKSGSPNRNLYVRVVLEDDQRIERGTLFRGYIDGSTAPHGSGAKPVKSTWSLRLDSWGSVASVNLVLSGTLLSKKRQAGGWTGTDESSLDGQGALRFVEGTNPSAVTTGNSGGESDESVPTGARWRLMAYQIKFVTSATSNNRTLRLVIKDTSNNKFWFVPSIIAQTASNTVEYVYYGGAQLMSAVSSQTLTIPIPINNILPAGTQIDTDTAGKRMGDNYSSPFIQVMEWIDIS